MFTINNNLKNLALFAALLFAFSCKNEQPKAENSIASEPKEILQDDTDSLYTVKLDTLKVKKNLLNGKVKYKSEKYAKNDYKKK